MAASRAAKVVPASPEPTEALGTSGANGNAATDLESATRTELVSGHSPTTTPMAAAPDFLGSYRSGDRPNREKREKKYAALLTAVTGSSERAKLVSVQGVLFAFTFMMSTFETSNR